MGLMKTIVSVFLPIFMAGLLWATPPQTYSQLVLKDLDQMTELVDEKIAESKAEGGDVAPLRAALQIVLSRPDDDFMVDKVIGPLRQALDENEAWESTLESVVDEAVKAMKNPKDLSASVQVTYAVLLTNVISQLKPRAQKAGFERKMIEKIRDARIVLTKKMRDDRKLRMMKDAPSPSQIAEEALTPPEKKK